MFKIIIIFFLSLIFNQNFSYSDEDWITITSPGKINSISYSNYDVFLASENGLFGYDTFNMNFYFIDDAFRRIENKEIYIVYHDSFRDHLWILNKDAIYFKSINSNIWRELDLYSNLNIVSNNNVLNIGSNYESIFIETRDEILELNPYSGILLESEIKNDFNIDNNIKWSSTSRSSLSDFVDLTRYFSSDQWTVINKNTLEHKGREVKITCVKEIDNNSVIVGTDSGEIFIAEIFSNRIKEVSSIPSVSNIKVAYLDQENEWWLADNDFFYLERKFSYEREVVFLLRWIEESNQWIEYYQNEYPGITSKDINRITRYKNNLYVATNFGLLLFDIYNNDWKLYDSRNSDLLSKITDMVVHEDLIYLATNSGLYIYSISLKKILGLFSKSILNNCEIYDLEFFNNKLYVLSSKGFYEINLLTNTYEFKSDKLFLNLSASNNSIVLSTKNKAYLFDGNDYQFLFTSKNISNIKCTDDFVWAHNDRNAFLYNITNENKYKYDSLDGIPGSIIYDFNLIDNWICFNTNNGITFYNWGKFHSND